MTVASVAPSATLHRLPRVALSDAELVNAVNASRGQLVERAGLKWDALEINSVQPVTQAAAQKHLAQSTRLLGSMHDAVERRIAAGKEALGIVWLGDRSEGGVGVDSKRLVFVDPLTANVTATVELTRGRG